MAPWEELAKQKRQSVESLIPEQWRIINPPSNADQRDVTGPYIHQFLNPQEIEITETDAVGIAAKTTTGVWSAQSVTTAFCHRAALAHQLTNCLLEIFFEDAIVHAKKLDAYLATNKAPTGPLHGVPVSLKDQFHVAGVETTMGYVGWTGTFQGQKGTGKEKVHESELVKELRALGAVLYCKTSVPHTLMSGESINNIMGYVWNPKNRNLSAGGSSGGEGALIGLKGSPLGFGSDIGGSVRIPAAFNGLYGLRPSAGRVPYEGAANSMDGQNTVVSVIGPLAGSVASLQFAMRAIISMQPWLHDPLCLEMPWRIDHEQQMAQLLTSGQPLAFGVVKHDGVVQPHPPVSRGVDIVTEALLSLGHKVMDWQPDPPHMNLFDITFLSWQYDGGRNVHEAFALSGEPPSPQIEGVYGKKPKEEKTATHIHETNVAKREAQKSYMEYWNSSAETTGTGRPVDCIICPVAPSAAAAPTHMRHYANTMWVNCLDYTSVVIPVTTADKSIDNPFADFKPLNDTDKMISETYDADLYDGAPVAVQLVGRRLQEEKMLVLADYVAKAVAAYSC